MSYARIAGTGSYLPEKTLTNADLEKIVDTSDEWIRSRTGIEERHIAADGEYTVDLAEKAVRNAMEAAGKTKDDIDLIIVATTTADRVFPSTACLLQKRLDIHGCAAFDVQAVCTGFVYALGIADKFFRSDSAKCAIVVGAYAIHLLAIYEARKSAEQGYPAAAARSEQSALDYERMEAERLREELEKKLSQAEEQWLLLRSMVQERLRRSQGSAEFSPEFEPRTDTNPGGASNQPRKLPEFDESGRAYSRW